MSLSLTGTLRERDGEREKCPSGTGKGDATEPLSYGETSAVLGFPQVEQLVYNLTACARALSRTQG